MGPQVEVADDRRPQPPDRVRQPGDAGAAQLGRLGGAAQPVAALEDEHPPAGPGEVRGGHERVVAAPDDDRLVAAGAPSVGTPSHVRRRAARRHQAAFRPRDRSSSIAAIRPFAPMIPPPGWVDDPHSQRSRIGVRNRA